MTSWPNSWRKSIQSLVSFQGRTWQKLSQILIESNFVKAFKVFGKKSGTELNRGTETDALAEKEKASDTAHSRDIQTKTTAELLDAAGDSSDSDDDYEADESESEESEDSDLSEIDSSPEHSSQEDESDEEDESINLNPSTVTDRSNVAGDNGGVTFVNLTKQLTRTDDSRGIYSLPMHRRCAAHQLNLVSKTDLRKIKDTVYVSLYKSTFDKCKKAWNLESRSTKTSDYIQSKMGILFIIPNSTRWSSFYRAAERVRRMLRQSPTKFNSVLKHCEVTPFTSSEEQFLKEYVKIMSYVADALDVLQGGRKRVSWISSTNHSHFATQNGDSEKRHNYCPFSTIDPGCTQFHQK